MEWEEEEGKGALLVVGQAGGPGNWVEAVAMQWDESIRCRSIDVIMRAGKLPTTLGTKINQAIVAASCACKHINQGGNHQRKETTGT